MKYSSLSEDRRIAFLEYKVVVRDLGSLPIDQIKAVFQRINSTSYGLNTMELNNSRYAGAFKCLGEWLSQQSVFERMRIFSVSDIRRMNDVRFCLGMLASIMGPYFNRDKELESFLSKYDESVPNEMELKSNIENVLAIIDAMNFSTDSRAAKKSDFFTLFVEMYKAVAARKLVVIPSIARSHLDRFYNLVEEAPASAESDEGKYYKASLQASNDRGSRILRGEIIAKILNLSANSA
jgi:hypothetical protein